MLSDSFEIKNAKHIRAKLGADFHPKIAIILGSGLGEFTAALTERVIIPYTEWEGLGEIKALEGHSKQLVAGFCAGVPVLCLEGRLHYYEGVANRSIQVLIRTLKQLGCETLLITNAAGSLCPDVPPASLVTLSDHINFLFHNPLTGGNDETFGPRFIDMSTCYNKDLRATIETASHQLGMPYREGVYIAVLGPSFETPAEIRAFRILGADLVGMSTVPEVIVGRHCGMRIAAISVVTNFAAGMSDTTLSHEQTLSCAQKASDALCRLLQKTVSLIQEP